MEDQTWAERAGTARDPAANTRTVSDVRPSDFFALGSNQPVGRDADAPTAAFRLSMPRPNPAAGSARIAFTLGDAGTARLNVFDALGREVARAADGVAAVPMTIVW